MKEEAKAILERFGFNTSGRRPAIITSLADVCAFTRAVAVCQVGYDEVLHKAMWATSDALTKKGETNPSTSAREIAIEGTAAALALLMLAGMDNGHDPIDAIFIARPIGDGWTFIDPEEEPVEELEQAAAKVEDEHEAAIAAAEEAVSKRTAAPVFEIVFDELDAHELEARPGFSNIQTIGKDLGTLLHRRKIHTAISTIKFFAGDAWREDVVLMSNGVNEHRRAAIIEELVLWCDPLDPEDVAIEEFDVIEEVVKAYDKTLEDLAGEWGEDSEVIKKAAGMLAVLLVGGEHFKTRPNALAAMKHELKRPVGGSSMSVLALCGAFARLVTRQKRHFMTLLERSQQVKNENGGRA